jgi:hypothetical protein
MESELPSDQHFEDELGVKGQQKSYNPWALKCHRDNLRKVGIHLVKVMPQDFSFFRFLMKLKNLLMINFFKCCFKNFTEFKM